MSICPNSTDEQKRGNNKKNNNRMYRRDYHSMMEGYEEENCLMDQESCPLMGSEKKRRLSVDQVKALEKNFEVENKLEPERKVKLAQELGLQPRQVAVWFQNRRARWKTKQLERDYGLLKANYDGLKLNFDKLHHDNEALVKEIRELKSKINNEDGNNNSENKLFLKDDEPTSSDTERKTKLENPLIPKFDKNSNTIDVGHTENGVLFRDHFKDGSSDSDSSAILNEENTNDGILNEYLEIHPNINSHNNNDHNNFQFQESSSSKVTGVEKNVLGEQQQYVKIEEHNFFGEESCSTFFSDDQAPSLHWYEWS